MTNTSKALGEAGAKSKNSTGQSVVDDPALQKESRQAVKNQSSVEPKQYPDRGETAV